ncbi:PREDICTED: cathepsin W isoform X1 [Hipposideros armiger]|uniref:Cathepsin W isoform X1 n=1 Tax=Hipposideros armiger TaxID=186990 RepID=A0A8B7RJB2_HIPAR|nr:PREDICTED: cathepsin W isoform X1 [Hipposideros armiger]
MTLTVHLSCFLVLLVAGLAQDIKGSLRGQDPGPRPLKLKEVFTLFQIQYNRSYSNPAEYAHRLDIFARNLAQAQRLQEEDLGTAEFGVTPFSDLTEEEFGQLYGHPRAAGRALNVDGKVGSGEWAQSVPRSCDWRKAAGVISPIKDQKSCKCCWAIAAAGNIESLWNIKHRQSVEVSFQGMAGRGGMCDGGGIGHGAWSSTSSLLAPELLDCDRCGDGCSGGFVWDAYMTVLNYSGLASEKDYPYQENSRTHKCQAKKYQKVAWIEDFIMLPRGELGMAQYLATEGPITVTINMKLLQNYQRGVIEATPITCDPQQVDHSVLLVGFGKSKSKEEKWAVSSQSHTRRSIPYWILKNSWGVNWGEEGYFRLHRGSNACGITKYPYTAQVTKPVKKQQQRVTCPP